MEKESFSFLDFLESNEDTKNLKELIGQSNIQLSVVSNIKEEKKYDADLIVTSLYLSSAAASGERDFIQKNRIVAIVNCCYSLPNIFPTTLAYKNVRIDDSLDAPLMDYIPSTIKFIEEYMKQGSVLVHCMAGISRSVSVVIAFLMKSQQLTYDDALTLVKTRRSVAKPNEWFASELKRNQDLIHHLAMDSP
jgi:predicted protein tyrosine phosphatase